MKIVYCDHCGKEITGFDIHEITDASAIRDRETKTYVGLNHDLCNECWDERLRLHVKLDRDFLHIDDKKWGKI